MDRPEIDVEFVARLARLDLSPEETELYQRQLEKILDYFKRLSAIDTSGCDPTWHSIDLRNVLRPDESRPSFPRGEMLSGAPETDGGNYLVPKVVE